METLRAISSRRSVRKFRPDAIPEEIIASLLRAAMSAPSAKNEQAWSFVVLTDRKLLDQVPEFSPFAPMAREAPLGILVCGDTGELNIDGYWPQDCAAATQNLLLAAHDLGLGAVWTGVYPKDDRMDGFRKLLRLPKNVFPFSFIPIGLPREEIAGEDRFRESKIHRNGW